jgi:hypothetical protein
VGTPTLESAEKFARPTLRYGRTFHEELGGNHIRGPVQLDSPSPICYSQWRNQHRVGLSNKCPACLDRDSTTIPRNSSAVSQMEANTELTAHGAVRMSATKTNATGAAKASIGTQAKVVSSGAAAAKSTAVTGSGAVHPAVASTGSEMASGGVAGNASGVLGGGSTTATGSSGSTGSGVTAHSSLVAHLTARLGAATKTAGVALKGSLAAKSLAVVAVGVTGLVVAAHTGVVPGAQAAISLVPSWSSGQSLLGGLQAGLSGNGSGGIQVGL